MRFTKKVTSVIKSLLKIDASLSDNDSRLMVAVHSDMLSEKGLSVNMLDANAYLGLVVSGALPSYDTITRTRRKIEEKYPEYRGLNWTERQIHSYKVRKEIVNQEV